MLRADHKAKRFHARAHWIPIPRKAGIQQGKPVILRHKHNRKSLKKNRPKTVRSLVLNAWHGDSIECGGGNPTLEGSAQRLLRARTESWVSVSAAGTMPCSSDLSIVWTVFPR